MGLWIAGSCQAPPADAYAEASRDLGRGALHHALAELDAVAPDHAHYAEARALAQAIERRLRAAQRLTLEGMRLRSEWRDDEAIEVFEDALRVWPGSGEAAALLLATRRRLVAMQATSEIAHDEGRALAMAPELVVALPPSSRHVPAAPGGAAQDPPPAAPSPLDGVRARLAGGEIDSAIERLVKLREAGHGAGEDLEVLLAAALHQRALTRYGQGYLEAAVSDWERVQAMGRGDDVVRSFLDAARTELRLRRQAASPGL